ncbi:MAG: CHRD domain-containing protein, partial [Cyanobacteria bacterium P01_D01_bin.116]
PRQEKGAVARAFLRYESSTQTLYFTIKFHEIKSKVTTIEFSDPSQSHSQTVFSHKVNHETEVDGTNQICSRWHKVPQNILDKLAHGVIYLTLNSDENPLGEVKGVVKNHRVLLLGKAF